MSKGKDKNIKAVDLREYILMNEHDKKVLYARLSAELREF